MSYRDSSSDPIRSGLFPEERICPVAARGTALLLFSPGGDTLLDRYEPFTAVLLPFSPFAGWGFGHATLTVGPFEAG